ncbi:thiamine-phosphate pyrophosphorylase [Anoxybacillus gonensis]|uniref:Thiamine-phosphate synthase n=1 Tax=Anoxybacillus gonensis TaxID=198467 RepID=A0AAW7TEW0_9BACL|nr:thiamine phosphate synthase [Anoxybacillus gonensis]AKS38454.1 thiamine-phosphate pyrophosphorylase [Anoxybacillus gonensis]KGP60380.1 thiamine-phosphate pyrophosphorylase [Anoxybacillus gonensis]MDO0877829.1 thiamine phosphate synthase [Anoxybacillus gonensis]
MMKQKLSLYFVMGSVDCTKDPLAVLDEAIEGGITMFQFREKGKGALIGVEKYRLAEKLFERCLAHNIPFIVNDDVDLALTLQADGVHVGQEDEAAERVRDRIGDRYLGVSVHNLNEVKQALSARADYVGLGPIFPTVSKEDAKQACGLAMIKHIRAHEKHVPLVAIGGITHQTAKQVIEAGADGIAVISAICRAEQIREQTKQLYEMVMDAKQKGGS